MLIWVTISDPELPMGEQFLGAYIADAEDLLGTTPKHGLGHIGCVVSTRVIDERYEDLVRKSEIGRLFDQDGREAFDARMEERLRREMK